MFYFWSICQVYYRNVAFEAASRAIGNSAYFKRQLEDYSNLSLAYWNFAGTKDFREEMEIVEEVIASKYSFKTMQCHIAFFKLVLCRCTEKYLIAN